VNGSKISLERITPQKAMIFKEVRLRALLDSPTAFSSTFATESTLTDDDWVARVAQWSSGTSTTYLALDGGRACGIASGMLDQTDPSRAHLLSMWVAPTHRRMGIGRSLVEAVLAWARAKNVQTMQLLVTSNNDTAIQFYQRLGFTLTGCTGTYANDPALKDYEMIRSLC
jgi:ribosomal protein S18 acetylase RimI-like enzyme